MSGANGFYTRDDFEVFSDLIEVKIFEGKIVAVSGGQSLNIASETGTRGKVLCRADLIVSIKATTTAKLVDGQAEVPIEMTIVQGMDETQPDVFDECDADSGGPTSSTIGARITVDGDVAVIQLRVEGQIINSVTLTR